MVSRGLISTCLGGRPLLLVLAIVVGVGALGGAVSFAPDALADDSAVAPALSRVWFSPLRLPPSYVVVTTPGMFEAAVAYAATRDDNPLALSLPALVETENRMREYRGDEPVDATDGNAVAEMLRSALLDMHAANQKVLDVPRFNVLLLGDAPPEGAPFDIEKYIPTFYRNRCVDEGLSGNEPVYDDVATDNPYASGDDDDDLPLYAIGRLPFDDPDQLANYGERLTRYEQSPKPGPWRRRVTCFAGPVGFEDLGEMIEHFIEDTYARGIAAAIDPAYDLSMTYANPKSPYTYAPSQFNQRVIDEINQGALVLNYVGHGWMTCVDRLDFRGNSYPIFTTRDAAGVDTGDAPPIAAFFTCHTGYFDYTEPCLAEALVLNPAGCLGVIASSRISSQSNYLLEVSFLDAITRQRAATLGDVFLLTKRGMVDRKLPIPPIARQLGLDISDEEGYTDNKRTHILEYNCFGDPTLRLALPEVDGIDVSVEIGVGDSGGPAYPGDELTVTVGAESMPSGRYLVTLEMDRLMLPDTLADNPVDSETFEETAITNHALANDRVVASAEGDFEGGELRLDLVVPDDVTAGRYHVKVLLIREGDEPATAIGSSSVRVKR